MLQLRRWSCRVDQACFTDALKASLGSRLQISLLHNLEVVRHVTGNNEGKRANCKWIVAGDAGAHPCFGGEILEERDRGLAHTQEFFYMRTK